MQVWSGIGDEIPYLLEPHSWPDLTFLDRSKADQSLRCENCQALLYIDIVGNRRADRSVLIRMSGSRLLRIFSRRPPMFHKRRGRGAIIEGIDTCRIHTITKKGERME